jgi:hypothetical protein
MCASPVAAAALQREPWCPRRVLLVGVAACHAIAFASLHAQLPGLYGRDGLIPISQALSAAEARAGGRAAPLAHKLRLLPTLLWLHKPLRVPPDVLAGALCLCGAALAGAAACAAAVRPCLGGLLSASTFFVLHLLYASMLAVGTTFLSFQWDILLLECTALAAVMAVSPALSLPPAMVWPPRLTLFKLMLASGAVKLQSGCRTWRELSALDYHFATQPLPTPMAWRAAATPAPLLRACVGVALALEGPAAWLLLCPLRRARHAGAAAQLLFQVFIALSGNYTFFNALTAVLALACLSPPRSTPAGRAEQLTSGALLAGMVTACCACFRLGPPAARWDGLRLALSGDDVTAALSSALPLTMSLFFGVMLPAAALAGVREARARGGSSIRVAMCIASALAFSAAAMALCTLTAEPLATLLPDAGSRALRSALPPLPSALRSLAAAAHVSSSYGLFRAMTGVGPDSSVARPELLLQGRNASAAASGDADAGWREIPFHFKPSPGRLADAPRWVAPHQPRLDWQMWFAALGQPHHAPWAVHLVSHLMRGTRDVWDLLPRAGSPAFSADAPPAEVRMLLYDMAFTRAGSAAAVRGEWWVANQPPRMWLPPVRLGPDLDAWLAGRGWKPPKKNQRRRAGRLMWARGGEAWVGAAVAAAGAGLAAAAMVAARREHGGCMQPHSKRE